MTFIVIIKTIFHFITLNFSKDEGTIIATCPTPGKED
jgi:hypothetical protein